MRKQLLEKEGTSMIKGRKEIFTRQGIKDFKRLYPVTSNSELAKIFKTTIATVEWKAEVLDLRKEDPIDILKRRHLQFKKKTVPVPMVAAN